mmetsp:Transcript_33053/g.71451  ORF Transcript_33053/g.71451 Transcript_33053/m.71451 type:complete len:203 (-) Transcript_33053:235-843(-)
MRGMAPLYKPLMPSALNIFAKQSMVLLYCLASLPCICVLTTSKGLFPSTLKQPAAMPPTREDSGCSFVLPLSVTMSLYLLKNINLSPWLELCFSTVANTPWYRPAKPLSARMERTPGTSDWFVSMSFVLIVSMGVTANIASNVPAPMPARNCFAIVSLPISSAKRPLKYALPPNRIPALGMEPTRVTPSPLYRDRKPVVLTV